MRHESPAALQRWLSNRLLMQVHAATTITTKKFALLNSQCQLVCFSSTHPTALDLVPRSKARFNFIDAEVCISKKIITFEVLSLWLWLLPGIAVTAAPRPSATNNQAQHPLHPVLHRSHRNTHLQMRSFWLRAHNFKQQFLGNTKFKCANKRYAKE